MNRPIESPLRAIERTPRGSGAVAVVEFAGPGALAHVRQLARRAEISVGDVRLARLAFADGVVDEALVVCLANDRVEVHLHGSPALVRAACAGFEAGNRTPRSIEERARAALEHAPCDAAARILLDQSEGALRGELERLAALDEVGARALAAELARRGRIARFALAPASVVLAGPANAGKSTLFNVLAGEARALVADEPGTTRDVLAADVLLGAWPARVFDTAGDRELAHDAAARTVEAEGQRRARIARAAADLVLWLVPVGTAGAGAPAGAQLVHTQADRAPSAPPGSIASIADPEGARRRVGEILRARFDLPLDPWVPGTAVPFEAARVAALDDSARGGSDPRRLARDWLDEV